LAGPLRCATAKWPEDQPGRQEGEKSAPEQHRQIWFIRMALDIGRGS
jgi:hypothetical protein